MWLDCGLYCASKTTDGSLTKTQRRHFFFSNDFSSEEKNKPNQNKKKSQHKPHHLTVILSYLFPEIFQSTSETEV